MARHGQLVEDWKYPFNIPEHGHHFISPVRCAICDARFPTDIAATSWSHIGIHRVPRQHRAFSCTMSNDMARAMQRRGAAAPGRLGRLGRQGIRAADLEFDMPVHRECFDMYVSAYVGKTAENTDVLDTQPAIRMLWDLALWRHPWRCEFVRAYPGHAGLRMQAVRSFHKAQYAEGDEKPLVHAMLETLPTEIVDIIFGMLNDGHFLRLARAFWLGCEARMLANTPPALLRLTDIVSWRRGHKAQLLPEPVPGQPRAPCAFRVCLDRHGLASAHRISQWPSVTQNACVFERYAIIDSKTAQQVWVRFEDGIARLDISDPQSAALGGEAEFSPLLHHRFVFDMPRIPLWDTPRPPPIGDCAIERPEGLNLPPWLCINATSLDADIAGITYLYVPSTQNIVGVYFHRRSRPDATAMALADKIHEGHQQDLRWLYIPVAAGDDVLAFGVYSAQYCHGVMLHTRLSGTTMIGSRHMLAEEDTGVFVQWLASKYRADGFVSPTPIMALHLPNHRGRIGPTSCRLVMGGYFRPSDPHETFRSPPETPDIETFWEPARGVFHACQMASPYDVYSEARLEDVDRVSAYYAPDEDELNTQCLQGLVLHYANGGARAVGCCRVGVDPVQHTTRPVALVCRYSATMSFSTGEFGEHLAYFVDAAGLAALEATEPTETAAETAAVWKRHPMQGLLQFYTVGRNTLLAIDGRDVTA